MMVGDSITAGYGLGPGEGLVDQLNRALADHQANIEILNAGVSGDTTAGGRARLGWSLADNPDAVILALGGNDLLRGIDPAESRRNLSAMLGMLAEAEIPVLLCGMVAMRNLGPEYEAAFNQIYPELAAEYQVQLYPFLLEGVALDRNAASVADPIDQLLPLHLLGSRGAGVVVDALLDDRAVHVVGAERERCLRDGHVHQDPVGLDVRNVVEHQSAHGELAQLVDGRRSRVLRPLVVLGVERERDVGLQAAGVVLLGDNDDGKSGAAGGGVGQAADAIELGRSALSKIRQNLGWALAYNLVGIPVAAGVLLPEYGISLNPAAAGAMMALSSVAVVTNSLLLKVPGGVERAGAPGDGLIKRPSARPAPAR